MEKFPDSPVLIIDDEINYLKSAEFELLSNGITNVECCQDSKEVMPLLGEKKYSVILLDIRMPDVDGEELLPLIVEKYPEIPVIIITGYGEQGLAVECMKAGAFDYEEKKKTKELLNKIQDTISLFMEIKTQSRIMHHLFCRISVNAKKKLPILITGETGVGKELVAKAIHNISRRSEYVAVNIAGQDDNILSDTLFGHKRGAFTDAYQDKKGLIEQAENGTIFLDEIGDLPEQSQIKLLRLIQEGEYYPIGAEKPKSSNARIVAATNKNVEEAEDNEEFRKDLYYRFTVHIKIPPLRERREDIPLLVNHFLELASIEYETKNLPKKEDVLKVISNYDFPGNVRELKKKIFDIVSDYQIPNYRESSSNSIDKGLSEKKEKQSIQEKTFPSFSEMIAIYYKEVMKRSNNIKAKAAKLAGFHTRTFGMRYDKLKEKFEKDGRDFADLPDFAELLKSLMQEDPKF